MSHNIFRLSGIATIFLWQLQKNWPPTATPHQVLPLRHRKRPELWMHRGKTCSGSPRRRCNPWNRSTLPGRETEQKRSGPTPHTHGQCLFDTAPSGRLRVLKNSFFPNAVRALLYGWAGLNYYLHLLHFAFNGRSVLTDAAVKGIVGEENLVV